MKSKVQGAWDHAVAGLLSHTQYLCKDAGGVMERGQLSRAFMTTFAATSTDHSRYAVKDINSNPKFGMIEFEFSRKDGMKENHCLLTSSDEHLKQVVNIATAYWEVRQFRSQKLPAQQVITGIPLPFRRIAYFHRDLQYFATKHKLNLAHANMTAAELIEDLNGESERTDIAFEELLVPKDFDCSKFATGMVTVHPHLERWKLEFERQVKNNARRSSLGTRSSYSMPEVFTCESKLELLELMHEFFQWLVMKEEDYIAHATSRASRQVRGRHNTAFNLFFLLAYNHHDSGSSAMTEYIDGRLTEEYQALLNDSQCQQQTIPLKLEDFLERLVVLGEMKSKSFISKILTELMNDIMDTAMQLASPAKLSGSAKRESLGRSSGIKRYKSLCELRDFPKLLASYAKSITTATQPLPRALEERVKVRLSSRRPTNPPGDYSRTRELKSRDIDNDEFDVDDTED
jgi:hypothetical protein